MTRPNLTLAAETSAILERLRVTNERFTERYPGEPPERQPVHVAYGGAQAFVAATPTEWGMTAMQSMEAYAPDPITFARALRLPGAQKLPKKGKKAKHLIEDVRGDPADARRHTPDAWLAVTVFDRVREKLAREPIEDFRIDFEDGFGVRPDDEEDAIALRVADEIAVGGALPPFIGIRIKPLNEEYKVRAVRTLDLVLSRLFERLGSWNAFPRPFIVTMPKVTTPGQVASVAELCSLFEERFSLPNNTLQIEIMIELTQSVFDPDGRLILPALVRAGRGRVSGAHFGTYDYTACNAVTAAHQEMAHPVCQHALHLMKIAYANTGIHLSDGATNVMPVPIHRGSLLTKNQQKENRRAVHRGWAASRENIQRSLENGYFQGWDMHPTQLVARYGATFAFFLGGFDAAAKRLKNFLSRAAEATLIGDVFDDAATGQALLNYFLRARSSGAVGSAALVETGLTEEEIESRSFSAILAGRTRRARG